MKQLNKFMAIGMVLFLMGCNKPNKENTEQMAAAKEALAQQKQADETMAIASKFMTSMNTGDMETMMSLMDENMVWQNEGDTTMPWIGPWNGKKAILEEFLPLFMENFKTTKWETEDAFSKGDVAAFFGRMEGETLKSKQKTGEFTFALRVKVKEGKIILWNWFEDSYAVSKAFNSK